MTELHVGSGQTYTTIQAAIAAANPAGGDTIIVHSGTYAENIVINKSLTLLSADGPGTTSIVGNGVNTNTVSIASGTHDVVIGGPGQGFTIVGTQATNDGGETAAVYLHGAVEDIEIRNNVITANGEAAMLSEWAFAVKNITVDGNTIGGNTFDDAAPLPVGHTVSPTNPSGFGTSPNQWNSDNVARQLVVLGQGYSSGSNAGNLADNIVFTNNFIAGNSGAGGVGAGLVNIEADNSVVSGNVFTGYSPSYEIRARGVGTEVTNNAVLGEDTIYVTPLVGEVSGNIAGGNPVGAVYLGTDGDDVFIGSSGDDEFRGGNGSDTVDYSATTGGMFITSTTATAVDPDTDNIGTDTLISIENAIGGSGNDTFIAASGVSNTFTGGGGNDLFNGGTGAGIDRFIYTELLAADSIATHAGTNRLIVNGNANGANEGVDDLRNVEEIQFADGKVVTVINGNAAVLTQADSLTVVDTDGVDAGTVIQGTSVLTNDINIDQGQPGDAKAVVAQTIEGTYGTLVLSANGTYTYTLKAAVDHLTEDASETFNYQVTDGTNLSAATLVINLIGGNDAPVITSAPVVTEAFAEGVFDTFTPAGVNIAPASNYVPTAAIAAALQDLLGTDTTPGGDVGAVLDLIEADLAPTGGTRADAIIAVFTYLNDFYTSGPTPVTYYYHVGHNTATIRLGIEYTRYLTEDGGAPLTNAMVKYAEDDQGNPIRQQSMHDNLLGNFTSDSLADRFGSPVTSTAIYGEISAAALTTLLDRPWIGGYIPGDPAAVEAARAIDQSLGLMPVASGQLTASDADGDAVTWSADTTGVYGTLTLDPVTGAWSYSLNPNDPDTIALAEGDTGTEIFNITADDGNGGTDSTTITITVHGANDAPVIDAALNGAVFTIDEEELIDADGSEVSEILAAYVRDVDSDTVSLKLTMTYGTNENGATPPAETIDVTPGQPFAFTPATDFAGSIIVSVLAIDAKGATSSSAFTLNVTNVNDAPTDLVYGTLAVDEDATGGESTGAIPNVVDADAADTHTYALLDDAGGRFVIDANTGAITVAAGAAFDHETEASVDLIVKVTDAAGASYSKPVTVAINDVNDAPEGSATAVLVDGAEDTPYVVSAADLLIGITDQDGDALSIVGLAADRGTVEDNGDGTYTITPEANYNGTVNLSYTVTDGTASIAATQNFQLVPVNDAPTGPETGVLVDGEEDIAYVIDAAELLAGFTDLDSDTLSVGTISADIGTVTDNLDGTFTLTTPADYSGTVTVSYSVVDDAGGSAAATRSVYLAPVNDAPRAETDFGPVSIGEDDITAINLLGGFVDVDGPSPISIQSISGITVTPIGGSPTVPVSQAGWPSLHQVDGSSVSIDNSYFNYLGVGESAQITFSYTVRDADGAISLPRTGSITVNGASEGFVFDDDDNVGAGTPYDDAIYALDGDDIVNAGAGDDDVYGGGGDDVLNGGSGNDRLYGEDGDDALNGGSGRDELYGGSGNDRLDGGSGDDILDGGAGKDVLIGGSGRDAFVFSNAGDSGVGAARDVITDFEANEIIDLSPMTTNGLTFIGRGTQDRIIGEGQVKFYEFGGNTYVVGQVGGQVFQIELTGPHDLTTDNFLGLAGVGTAAADANLVGTMGDDWLWGLAGDDHITGGLGKDVLHGGEGADVFVYHDIAESTVGAGRDVIADWSNDDKIDLGDLGSLSFVGQGSVDRNVDVGQVKFYQTGGNTYVVANTGSVPNSTEADFQIELRGTHTLTADSFNGLTVVPGLGTLDNDILVGTDGSDTLRGLAGNDTLTGGLGTDILFGGAGNDTFDFNSILDSVGGATRDVIRDWNAGDKIDLHDIDANGNLAGNQDFNFVGTVDAGLAIANYSVGVFQAYGNTYVIADADGDGIREFQIEIYGTHNLTAVDFIF